MKQKILILTTVSGFLPQFLKSHMEILKGMGAELFYASNFEVPAYEFEESYFKVSDIETFSIPIERSPYQIRKNGAALRTLIKIIDEKEIDLIHCHNPVGGILGRMAGFFAKRDVTVVYTAHGFHFYQGASVKNWTLYYMAEKLMARWTDHLITINQEDYNRAKYFRLKQRGEIHLLPGMGVDEEKYRYRPEKYRKIREELNVAEDEICLMTSALLHPDKNYQTVLQALARLENVPFRYFICGEGPFRSALEEMVKNLGIQEKVTFLGFRKDMDQLLNGADLFLFPSIREGLGMAALEALFCGVPVIATENRGTREYLSQEENGILLGKNDVEGFAKAICKMAERQELRKKMQENALKTAERFGRREADRQAKRVYARIYDGLRKTESEFSEELENMI